MAGSSGAPSRASRTEHAVAIRAGPVGRAGGNETVSSGVSMSSDGEPQGAELVPVCGVGAQGLRCAVVSWLVPLVAVYFFAGLDPIRIRP